MSITWSSSSQALASSTIDSEVMMKVLVLGSGGREAAIVRALSSSELKPELFALPGNGGIKEAANLIPGSVTDIPFVVEKAQEIRADYVVVTPDDPLALGAVDALNKVGIPCFGPEQVAARIESSKAFAKDLMKKYHIPTAKAEVFTEVDKALSYLQTQSFPIVIKADGLALGKGVIIAKDRAEAEEAVLSMLRDEKFGKSGKRIIIEEFLTGPEVTILSFCDGKTLVPMISSMDHKRAKDGDEGLNTGGMGCIAPNPYYTPEIAKLCMDTIFRPTVDAMIAEGCPFKGCLYFGLMLTPDGPKVIEYNSRFGDPETQTILPLLESDLLKIMMATTEGTLKPDMVKFSNEASCSIALTSAGYPESYKKGFKISIKPNALADIYIAGAKEEDGELFTSGGRVINVVATAPTLKEAVERAYTSLDEKIVTFEGMSYRHDIGKKALEI